jgi:CheY-like chemotaxis protein
VPAIALSANVDAEEIQQAIEAGFSTYLTKPVDWPQLLSAFESLVPRQS